MNKIHIELANYLTCIQKENEYCFRKVINTSFIRKIANFQIKLSNNKALKYNCYHKQVMRFLPKVTNKVILSNCNITKNQFRKIIQVGRHIKEVKFLCCSLVLDGLVLDTNLDYSIRLLSFTQLDQKNPQASEEFLESLKTFARAASQTSLKTSLKLLCIQDPMTSKITHKYFKNLNFSLINLQSPPP
ncbi:unnamed protein product [Moneuplotes crassus]|uniref:Uncharacterized protein n=1 Tax=Euplotes crassus TaxID=5936 RepID=A0AAD2D502_EUPCR|nr:unnamed protein product [Moneuplotes crassus]